MSNTEYVIDLDKVNNSEDMIRLLPLLLRRYHRTYTEEEAIGFEHVCTEYESKPSMRMPHSGSEAARTMDDWYMALARQMAQNMDRQLLQAIGGRR